MTRAPVVAAFAAALLSSCAHAPAAPGAKPEDCAIDFYWEAPKRGYVAVGAVSAFVTAHLPRTPAEPLRRQACALGADAVLVTQDVPDQFDRSQVSGTAIRYEAGAPAREGGGAADL
jgi:hypothetical protein